MVPPFPKPLCKGARRLKGLSAGVGEKWREREWNPHKVCELYSPLLRHRVWMKEFSCNRAKNEQILSVFYLEVKQTCSKGAMKDIMIWKWVLWITSLGRIYCLKAFDLHYLWREIESSIFDRRSPSALCKTMGILGQRFLSQVSREWRQLKYN